MSMWEKYLLVSLVVMCLAHTITQEAIFRALRDWLGGRSTWCGYLICCPYCFTHWLAFVLTPLFGLKLLSVSYDWGPANTVLDWFFNSVLVVILAAFIRMVFYAIDYRVGVFRTTQEKQEREVQIIAKRHPDVEQKLKEQERAASPAEAA